MRLAQPDHVRPRKVANTLKVLVLPETAARYTIDPPRHTSAPQVVTEPGSLARDASAKEETINRLSEEGRLNSETLCTTCIVEKVRGLLVALLG